MKLNGSVFDDLYSGEKSICFFVHHGKCYWVLDHKYNFSLDAERDFKAHLDKGNISKEQYALACENFRGGVLRLNSESFLKYLELNSDVIVSRVDLEAVLNFDGIGNVLSLLNAAEKYFLSGVDLSAYDFQAAGIFSSRLPMFYVNFDREIYMHLDHGRFHEDLVYPGWVAKVFDFNFLIPEKEKYWINGGDCWKIRFIQSGF
ncbi:hypothetical protein KWH04_19100 [Xanthomonas campestris pv. trichodesmae]|uniref:Uncharacterized protein n=1 Tax=Xanthomonas citri pv. vignicola TaxID=473426 RepID=A0AB33CIQ6_XANCI|nr:hypothetical protein [Xanthomonas citri]ASK92543.1 hypothetical protein XcvCFBP7111P_14525 [Xanthomonas citri pv. vignicola]MBV6782708.1 hypothetical protein [Xanthomonas campestris pv. trichodesmae]